MPAASAVDPVHLAAELIARPSVTPADAGALGVLAAALGPLGFACESMASGGIENLYARFGQARPHLCFAGHTDVVPPGDLAAWTSPPFEPRIEDGRLLGRGAADMKSAIAAFVVAAGEAIAAGEVTGSLSLMITGDEEGEAIHGTRFMVETLRTRDELIDHCLVGEPTSAERLGDMIKIGRRGSINAAVTVEGVQGHVAYPHRAANPAPVMVRLLAALLGRRLDDGYEAFQPSNLEVTSIDIDNPATNVIPGSATARVNIRFNPAHTGAELAAWIEAEAARAGEGFAGTVRADCVVSGEAFLTPRGEFTQLVAGAVEAVSGVTPELSTTGGTSDARFIRSLCEVVEFGLVGASMHRANECASVDDIRRLSVIYRRVIADYFTRFQSG